MNKLDELLELADRWDETPANLRGSPETFCENNPELLADFKNFLSQRNLLDRVLQGGSQAANPNILIGGLQSQRFRPMEFLNSGGLGWVYLADDLELRRKVAIKCLQPLPASDPVAQQRFVREAEVTAKLEHPGIVPVYGLIQQDSQYFYAMRFVEGETMRDRIRRLHSNSGVDWRGLEAGRLLKALCDVCNAIAFAHSRGVIHRDLKPLNIMLGPFGETLVLDWGLAKLIDQSVDSINSNNHRETSQADTQSGETVGTIGFMSPEQASGDWENVGPKSDQFALGAMLYQILTNQAPFSGTLGLANSLSCQFAAPRTINKNVPKPLEAISLKAMQKSPSDRYESVMDLKMDIERYLADCPVEAYKDQWFEQFQRLARRHRSALRIGVLLLVCIIGLLGYFLTEAKEQNRLLEVANTQAQSAAKSAREAAEREQLKAEQAELERQRADEEAKEANLLVLTMIQMLEQSSPQDISTPTTLADWIKDQLNNEATWQRLKPDRAGMLRLYFAIALSQNNHQQEAVPHLRIAVNQLSEGSENKKLLFRAKTELGLLLLSQTAGWQPDPQRRAEGLALLHEAVDLTKQIGEDLNSSLLRLSMGFRLAGDTQSAIELNEQIIQEALDAGGQNELLADAYLFVAPLWIQNGQLEKTILAMRDLLAKEADLHDLQVIQCRYQLASALGMRGLRDFPEALSLLEQAYAMARRKFGTPSHPSVSRIGFLFASLAYQGGTTPPEHFINMFAEDYETVEIDNLKTYDETYVAASVALARSQLGNAKEFWNRCNASIEKSISLNPTNPSVYYLRILLAKSMAMQEMAKEALPLINSVDQAQTDGPLKGQNAAKFLRIPTLNVLYGTNYLLGDDAEVERIKQRYPPGVPLPQFAPK